MTPPLKKSIKSLFRLSPLVLSRRVDVPRKLLDGYEDYKSGYNEIVQPQWDQVVDMLNQFGYLHVYTMLEQIQAKKEQLIPEAEKAEKEANSHDMLFALLNQEASIYGPNVTILDSLGFPDPKSSTPHWWKWQLVSYGTQWGDQPTRVKPKYEPIPTGIYLQSFSAEAMPKHRSSLDGELTWQQAIDYIAEMGKMIYEIFEDQNGALDIAIFRESVIKNVLQEYELLGAAYTFAERTIALYPGQVHIRQR